MAEKIKILIVDDNESTREGTSRLLEYEDNIEIVGFAENGAEAVERVKELQPHVVLMDINMPVLNGIDATAQISQDAPRTKVIMVSVQDDSQYLKQAFRAGAVDFVAKPITSAELAQAIERAYNTIQTEPVAPPPPPPGTGPGGSGPWPMTMAPSQEGHVIGILGFKGGAGKTTIAVNMGIALAKMGKKVVVVDSHLLFGDVSIFLNTKHQYNIVDFSHMVAEMDQFDHEMVPTILASHESGLKLLIAPANPGEAEAIASQTMVNLLTVLRRDFEYVIVDTSTGLDEILLGVIQTADKLLIVLTPVMTAIKDAKILLNELASFEATEKAMIVINQVDKNVRITPDQIANYLKVQVSAQIPADPTVNEAINQSIPLVTLDPRRAPSVRPLMDMVQSIRDTFEASQAVEEQPVRRGLFGLGGK